MWGKEFLLPTVCSVWVLKTKLSIPQVELKTGSFPLIQRPFNMGHIRDRNEPTSSSPTQGGDREICPSPREIRTTDLIAPGGACWWRWDIFLGMGPPSLVGIQTANPPAASSSCITNHKIQRTHLPVADCPRERTKGCSQNTHGKQPGIPSMYSNPPIKIKKIIIKN